MFRNRAKKYDDDDGRVIASMNVPGMPGYIEGAGKTGDGEKEDGVPEYCDRDELHGADLWRYIRSATAAALVVAGVMVAGLVLFTLFCTEIWLK